MTPHIEQLGATEMSRNQFLKKLRASTEAMKFGTGLKPFTHTDILDQYRLEQSKLYLQQGKSLSEIAERLNYADQSAFGRAFKRWTGVTPKQFLKSL